jgi:hypothetical protein
MPVSELAKDKVVVEPGRCWMFCINTVNPRFNNYNKPILLALTVGMLTIIFTFTVFVLLQTFDCTHSESILQNQGSLTEQRDFLHETLGGVSGRKPSGKLELCLTSVATMSSASQVNANYYTQTGTYPLLAYKCYPPDGWLTGGVVGSGGDADEVDFGGYGTSICSPEKYQVNNFNVTPPADSTISGVDSIKANADFDMLVCQWQDSTTQRLELKATYRLQVEECVSAAAALGTALAYATYIEIAFTVLVVVILTKLGILKSNQSLLGLIGGAQALVSGAKKAGQEAGGDEMVDTIL